MKGRGLLSFRMKFTQIKLFDEEERRGEWIEREVELGRMKGVSQWDRSTFLYPSLPSVCLPLWSLLRLCWRCWWRRCVCVGGGGVDRCLFLHKSCSAGEKNGLRFPLVSYPPQQAGGLACLCSSDIRRHLNSPVRREHNAPGRS